MWKGWDRVVGLRVGEQVVSESAMRGDALHMDGSEENVLLLSSFWRSDYCVIPSGSGEVSSILL